MNTDLIEQAQARVTRLQAALDDTLTGKMRSGLDASTAAGTTRIGFFKPDIPVLQAELVRAQVDLARLQGDQSAIRRAFAVSIPGAGEARSPIILDARSEPMRRAAAAATHGDTV